MAGAGHRGPAGGGLARRARGAVRSPNRHRHCRPASTARRQWWAAEIAWWRHCLGVDEPTPECAATPWALLLAGRLERIGRSAWRELGCPYEEALALWLQRRRDDLRAALRPLRLARRRARGGDRGRAGCATRRHAWRPRGARARDHGPTRRASPPASSTCCGSIAQGLRNADIAEQLVCRHEDRRPPRVVGARQARRVEPRCRCRSRGRSPRHPRWGTRSPKIGNAPDVRNCGNSYRCRSSRILRPERRTRHASLPRGT